METYSFLRGLADSWFLVLLVVFFVGVVIFVFRPSARRRHDDAAKSIFRNENRPAEADDDEKEGR